MNATTTFSSGLMFAIGLVAGILLVIGTVCVLAAVGRQIRVEESTWVERERSVETAVYEACTPEPTEIAITLPTFPAFQIRPVHKHSENGYCRQCTRLALTSHAAIRRDETILERTVA